MAKRYTYEAIQGSGLSDAHFRITDTVGDDRVATSYLEENARIVVDLMNRGEAAADLLQACKAALPILSEAVACGLLPEDDMSDRLALDTVEAAIRKAEG